MDWIGFETNVDRQRLKAVGLGGNDDPVAFAASGLVSKPCFRFLQITGYYDRVTP